MKLLSENKPYLILFLVMLVVPVITMAQNGVESEHDNHNEHDHSENGFELGVGAAGTYLVHDKEWAPGAHLHLMYGMGKFSTGLGFESVFAEERHLGVGIMFAYRPLHGLEFSVAPSILFVTHETSEVLFTMHFEAVYAWELNEHLHLGPLVGYGYNPDDQHISLGLHLGIHF